jgi:hypothetical protein
MKTKKHKGKSAIGSSSKAGVTNIKEATASYEKWMRTCTTVISSDLLSKHEQMKESPGKVGAQFEVRSQDRFPIEIGSALRLANRHSFWMTTQCILFQVDAWVA